MTEHNHSVRKYFQYLLKFVLAVFAILVLIVLLFLGKQFSNRGKSFYQKLTPGSYVNILVVGDSIGEGAGASDGDYMWYRQLRSYLWEHYKVIANFTNVSMGGNTSYAGYARVMMLDDSIDYDLAIICYGQNDGEKDFSMYYESIIRAISQKYEGCSIISILESSQRSYTNKMQAIQSLCEYYNIPTADTIEPFLNDYDSYSSDGVHPNDNGHAIYAECLEKIIDEAVQNKEGIPDYNLEPLNESVVSYDKFRYISADEFTKIDDTTFSLNTSVSGILGIDYSYIYGENIAEIHVDGESFTTLDITFNYYNTTQRHILQISDDCTVENEIQIVFDNEEQASKFRGLIFSWGEE